MPKCYFLAAKVVKRMPDKSMIFCLLYLYLANAVQALLNEILVLISTWGDLVLTVKSISLAVRLSPQCVLSQTLHDAGA